MANWHDPSLMREALAFDFLGDAGVLAPLADYVQLLVNDRDYGVYTDVEDIDKRFLDRIGLDRSGNLYRCNGDFSLLPDSAAYAETYEKKTNEDEGIEDIIAFIELVNTTPAEEFFPTISARFDIESFYRLYAANVLLGNLDFGYDDYYLHHDLVDDVWTWLPWDYNETWGIVWLFQENLVWNTTLLPGDQNQLIHGYLAHVPHFRRRHVDRVRQLLDTHFSPESTAVRFESAYGEVDLSGHLDWFKWYWQDNTKFEASVSDLTTFVNLRTGFLLNQLPVSGAPEPALVINEIMARNFSTLADEHGEYEDWIEIYNTTAEPIGLGGYYLSDRYGEPTQWAFPDTSLGAGGYLVVWCDGDTLQGAMHASFKLDGDGESVGLFGRDENANQPIDTQGFGEQAFDVAFGRLPDGGYAWGFLPTPTPGAPNVAGGNFPPTITGTAHEPSPPTELDSVWVASTITDDSGIQSARVHYDAGSGFFSVEMRDDGSAHDGESGDGRYGAAIEPHPDGTRVRYYVEAIDDSGVVRRDPLDAPAETFFYDVGFVPPPLFINEFLASNSSVNADEFGEFDDWVEIFNGGSEPVALGGKHLTDDLGDPTKWTFPDTTLAAGAFLLIWCDGTPAQGALHAGFKLDADGEEIGIFESEADGLVPIDTFVFGTQTTDVSHGRLPDGADNWTDFTSPTPGESNGSSLEAPTGVNRISFVTLSPGAPNPASGSIAFAFELPRATLVRLEIFDVAGRRIRTLLHAPRDAGGHRLRWDGTDARGQRVASGVYFCRLSVHAGAGLSRKFLLAR